MSETTQQLQFLTKVDLSGNQLTKVRQVLCRKLQYLNLDNNQIAEMDMRGHSKLKNLSLNKNKLINLKGLENLTNLETLSAAENPELAQIGGIENCPKLKTLDIQKTKVESFETVPDLPSLQEINMTGCPIAKLEEIGKLITLKSLQSINLTETPIAEEKGDDLKKEVLIILDGLNFKTFNGEEVSAEDIADAKNEKAERLKAAEEARK